MRAGNLEGIAGLMVTDLKTEKFVNGGESIGVLGKDADAGTAARIFQRVMNVVTELFHGCGAGRILCVDKHGSGKITGGKHFYDMAEVGADFIASRGVLGGVRFDFDGAAIGVEEEVVGRFVVGKAHDVIAALDDALVWVSLRGRLILGKSAGSGENK
jgi:hypothetical protein